MNYGKKYKFGNYTMVKYSKPLSKGELGVLRESIPEEVSGTLAGRSVPYIKVGTVSGSWAVEFSVATNMFTALDGATEDELRDEETSGVLQALFSGFYADTTVLGDREYNLAKSEALRAFIERQKPSDGDDSEILDGMKRDIETEEAVSRAVKEDGDEQR